MPGPFCAPPSRRDKGVGTWRLAKGVCYERYGEHVYLRHIDARKDFLFNPLVYDLLGCFSGGPRTEEEVRAALLEAYDAEDTEAFRREIGGFLRQLEGEGILKSDREPPPEAESPVELAQAACEAEGRLFSAALELTYRCNERCIHCYADDPPDGREELTLAEYRTLLEDLRDMGCVELLLTGGEVCVKDCFLQVAQYAASLGMAVDIFTNGLGLTPELFDALKALKPNSLSFSLYGGRAVHDQITGVPGSFDRTLRAVMAAKCAGFDTYIKTVVMRENLGELEALLRLGRRLEIPVTAGFAVLDTHTGRSGAAHQLTEPEDIRRALELLEGCRSFAPGRRDPRGPVCSGGRTSLSVDPYGEVRPCVTMPVSLGNVRQTPVRRIWEGAPELRAIRNRSLGSVCPRRGACPNIDYCEVCLGRVLAREDGGVPEDVCVLAEESRRLAEKRKRDKEEPI